MKLLYFVICAILSAIAAGPAGAERPMQDPPMDSRRIDEGGFAPDPGRGAPPPGERRDDIRKKIEAIRIWRLTEELNLDEAGAAKFFPAISAISQKRQELLRETMESQRELRFSLDASRPDERKIKAALERMERAQRELQRLQEREIEATKDHLTIEQQARYFLFQQDFQREMREMISGARAEGQNRGMGPGAVPSRPRGGPGMGEPPLPR